MEFLLLVRMPHNFNENLSVLRRWQAHGGGALPSDWETFERGNILASQALKERDPELVSLLDGSASAGLVADALSGKLPTEPPNFAEIQRQAEITRERELMTKFEDGKLNLTEAVELENRNPEAYAKAVEKVSPSPEQVRQSKAQKQAAEAAVREASKRQAHVAMMNRARSEGQWR